MPSTYPDPNVPDVESSQVLWGDVADAIDKERQAVLAKPAIAYVFGAGRIIKRDHNIDPYQE